MIFQIEIINDGVPNKGDTVFISTIESKIMFLGCVIGCRSMTIRRPPSGLSKNSILNSIYNVTTHGLFVGVTFG
jgi:hypothetical protein